MDLKEAFRLATSLIDETDKDYDLPRNLDFAFDRAKRRLGSYRPQRLRITLSAPICSLNSADVVEEIIRHELAHALAHYHDNKLGHGPRWKQWAIEMGAIPRASCQSADVITPMAPYVYVCPECSFRAERYRRPSRNRGKAGCSNCSNREFFQPLKFKVNGSS